MPSLAAHGATIRPTLVKLKHRDKASFYGFLEKLKFIVGCEKFMLRTIETRASKILSLQNIEQIIIRRLSSRNRNVKLRPRFINVCELHDKVVEERKHDE